MYTSLQVDDVKEDNISNSVDALNIIAYALDTTKDDSSRLYENKQIQTDINTIRSLKTTGTQYDNCLIQLPTTTIEKFQNEEKNLIEPIKLLHHQKDLYENKSENNQHVDNTNKILLMHPKLSVTPHKPDVHNKLYQHIIIDSPQNNENNSMELSIIVGHSEQNKKFIARDVKRCDNNDQKIDNQLCKAAHPNKLQYKENKLKKNEMSFNYYSPSSNRKVYNHKAFQKTILAESPKFSKTIKSIMKTAHENNEKREYKGNEIKAAKIFIKSVERKRDKTSSRYKESSIVSSDDFSSLENSDWIFKKNIKQKLLFNEPQTVYSSSDCEFNKENLNFLSRESLRRLRCERELLQYLSSTSETSTYDLKNIVSVSSELNDVNLSEGEILSMGEIREED